MEVASRSTNRFYDAKASSFATATEQSVWMALLRRIVGFVPYLENVVDWLPIPYHFSSNGAKQCWALTNRNRRNELCHSRGAGVLILALKRLAT